MITNLVKEFEVSSSENILADVAAGIANHLRDKGLYYGKPNFSSDASTEDITPASLSNFDWHILRSTSVRGTNSQVQRYVEAVGNLTQFNFTASTLSSSALIGKTPNHLKANSTFIFIGAQKHSLLINACVLTISAFSPERE